MRGRRIRKGGGERNWCTANGKIYLIAGLTAILAALAFFAFGTESDRWHIDIRGTITDIVPRTDRDSNVLGSILVEGRLDADTQYDKANITITNRTRISSPDGSSLAFEALHVGQRVEVTFTGPVAESYPVQAAADRLVVWPKHAN